ncbi:MAG: hypothetical protein Q8O67_27740 [Deltaproteobacteria bacterium]|nr:hypothetical protein [Deltaproteobacteria bacterium]
MKSLITVAALAAVVASFGCATDPNKAVKAADAAHAADVRDSNQENVELTEQQKKDHAALDSDHSKQDASLDKKFADDASKGDKAHDTAKADVVEARRTFRAEALARLQTVEGKATALESKKKKSQEALLGTLRGNCAAVSAQMTGLDGMADAQWFAGKQAVESSLAALEKDVHEIENKG